MATLTANINSSARIGVRVTSPGTFEAGRLYHIDDEIVRLSDFQRYPLPWSPRDHTRWNIERGMEGTTPASHTATTAITAVGSAYAEGGGGGSGVTATDTQIVFMDGTDAVGSASLTWVESGGHGIVGLMAGENDHAEIVGLGVGTEITIRAAEGDATHVGGELTLQSGASSGQSGGQMNLLAGNDDADGDGGAIIISSGYAAGGASGDIDLRVGPAAPSNVGGAINIIAGVGATGSGGSVIIQGGSKITGGSHGTVQLYEGSNNNSIELNAGGLFVFGGLITFDSLPSVDPGNAGQLYTDGAPSAGVPKALMVSGG